MQFRGVSIKCCKAHKRQLSFTIANFPTVASIKGLKFTTISITFVYLHMFAVNQRLIYFSLFFYFYFSKSKKEKNI